MLENDNLDPIHSVKIGHIYQHYKGKQYKVLSIARHTDDLSWLVVYECLYHNPKSKIWVRPLNQFIETITTEKSSSPRFVYIGQK